METIPTEFLQKLLEADNFCDGISCKGCYLNNITNCPFNKCELEYFFKTYSGAYKHTVKEAKILLREMIKIRKLEELLK